MEIWRLKRIYRFAFPSFLLLLFVNLGLVAADINEVSWKLRMLVNNTRSTDRSEVAVLLLPCAGMLQGGHVERFLIKLLGQSDVDYQHTRVSLW